MARLRLRGALLADPETSGGSAGSGDPGGRGGAGPEDLRAAGLQSGDLLIEAGRIAARLAPGEPGPGDAATLDLAGAVLAPGFVDLHHHGAAVFAGEGGVAAAVRHDAVELARHGVTAFLVTTVAWSRSRLEGFLAEALGAGGGPRTRDMGAGARGAGGALPLGIHLEGPWISPAAAGAQPAGAIRPFDPARDAALLDAAEGRVRMVTFAPEVRGALRLQGELARRGILGALGHSTARRDDAERVMQAGARHVTHLYNAMRGVHHREPGLAGLALADERLTADLICDGVHVHPDVVRFSARALGERLVLISDRVAPGHAAGPAGGPGAAPGAGPDFGGEPLREADGAWRLRDGRLAGSSLTLERAVVGVRSMAGLPLLEAIAAATVRPARLLGMEAERGTLRPGARADLVALDGEGRVLSTWVGGRRVYARAPQNPRVVQ